MIGFALFLGLFLGICAEWFIQENANTTDINWITGVWLVLSIIACLVAIFGYYEGWFLTEEVLEVLVQ